MWSCRVGWHDTGGDVDADNFGGMYGKPAYTIASTISDALASGAGLEEAEILGAAADNADVEPKAPTNQR